MPRSEDIHRYLLGAWRMMTGRRDGLRLLDLSLDGFWNSFFAIIVALPVMLAGWVSMAADLTGVDASFALRLSMVLRLAIVDIGAWLVPVVALAVAAPYIGVRDRFVPYVVASNWGSVLYAWFMLPPNLLRLIWPDATEPVTLLALIIFLICLALSWRLTDAAIGKGAGIATAVFAGMLIASIVTLFALQALLGVAAL